MKCSKCKANNPDTQSFCGDCGTQLGPPDDAQVSFTKTLETPVEELTTGSTFADRYQVIEELGKGGMGKVYKVLDKETNEKIAIKLIKPEIASDKKTVERFRNELTTARKIGHRNVCRMYDLNKEKDSYYITMEYVPGQDLKGLIRQSGQLAVGTTINIAQQICEGLSEAHKLGTVHRDLKPSNIMIDKEGNVRIMDFGIARSRESKGLTGAGVMIGTPEYMSPEQVEGKDVDKRSDIYSLGVILYEMVTGRLPFEGDTPLSIAMKHKSEAPKEPKELNTQIPHDLSSVILRCMEKDKENRYQQAKELLSELNNIDKSIPTTEKVPSKREPKTVKIGEIKWKSFILYVGVAVFLILLIAGGIYLFTRRGEAIDSIAVLPFENANPDTEYLSDGITESLINKLSQLPGMKKVIARGSVFRYKGKEIDPRSVGQELGVDTVLISQMSQRGDELSISVELMRVRDNSHIWGNQYKQKISEIFAIQEEISNSITDGLRLRLTEKELKSLTKRHTENTDAYQAYLKGRYYWNKRTEEGFQKGIEYFEQAIETDPTYALAYAGIADCYNLLQVYAYLSPKEAFPKARVAAEKALEIDSSLAEAHISLAWIRMSYDLDWSAGEKEFKRALELNPSYATGHHWHSIYLTAMGRHTESLAQIKRAQELDPLSLMINTDLGFVLFYGRQDDLAIEQYLKTLEMDKDFVVTYWRLAIIYAQKEMYSEALAATQKMKELLGDKDPLVLGTIGYIYALLGKRDEAKKVLNELSGLSKHRYISSLRVALIYMGLGQKDQTFKWLEKAYEERDFWITLIKVAPPFDRLRSDPRFKILLKKMNLE